MLCLLLFYTCLAKTLAGLNHDVVIVGAGAAGIAAASKLSESDVKVTILEAENRLGGRVHSVRFGDAVVDLGAEWCHGQKNNVVYETVKDMNLLGDTEISNFQLVVSDRRNIAEDFGRKLLSVMMESVEGDENFLVKGMTTGEYIMNAYNHTISSKFDGDDKSLALEGIDTLRHFIQSLDGSFSWFDSSANSSYTEAEGNQHLNWKGTGYKTFLDILTSKDKFKKNVNIIYNEEVTKIKFDSKITLMTKSDEEYVAEVVIFTPSLSVLKHVQSTMFEPGLPAEKVDAIKKLGIAAVMKVWLHFPRNFWPKSDFAGHAFLWSYADRDMMIIEFPYGPKKNGRSWILDLMTISTVENNPNVLCVWFSGELVPEIENISDELLVRGIMFTLEKFLGQKYQLSQPDQVIRSNWYSNPHFRGTYSFDTNEMHPNARKLLQRAVNGPIGSSVLRFAGEATNEIHFSTVHGAVESGYREAQIILDSLK